VSSSATYGERRAIMERMGHSTITGTLDTYGHLLPKLDATLDDAIDAMYRGSVEDRRSSVAHPS
jgi:hypothetical protein